MGPAADPVESAGGSARRMTFVVCWAVSTVIGMGIAAIVACV